MFNVKEKSRECCTHDEKGSFVIFGTCASFLRVHVSLGWSSYITSEVYIEHTFTHAHRTIFT